jgi:hypothetical protein
VPTLVDGGQGSDVVARGFFDGSSRLEVRGGDGFDRVEYVASTSGVVVSKDDVANDVGRGSTPTTSTATWSG